MPMCTLACNRIVRVNDARAVLPISHDSVLEATTGFSNKTVAGFKLVYDRKALRQPCGRTMRPHDTAASCGKNSSIAAMR